MRNQNGIAPKTLWGQIIGPLIVMWILVSLTVTLTNFAVGGSLAELKVYINESMQINELSAALLRLRNSSRDAVLSYSMFRNNSSKEALAELHHERAKMVDQLRNMPGLDRRQRVLISQYDLSANRNREIENRLLDRISDASRSVQRAQFEAYGQMDRINGAYLHDLASYTKNVTGEAETSMSRIVNSLAAVFSFGLMLSAMFIGAIAYYYRRKILSPLEGLEIGFRAVARGHLSYQLNTPEVKGQMGDIIDNFNSMTRALRETREDLTVAREEALRAAGAKSEFLSNMSHEIRTPLNAIIGMADVIWDLPLSDEVREYVRVLRRSGSHLLNLVNDILDYSRLEEGMIRLSEEPCDLRTIIDSLRAICEPLTQARDLELRIHMAPDLPRWICADENRLKQVLLNLIGNAVKFTDRGRVELIVDRQQDGDGPRLLFSVVDTGVGIPEDKLDQIFLRFSQVDSGVTKPFSGTGLGLAISKQLVEMMGGDIVVQSVLGQGSTFSFCIPLVVSDPASASSSDGTPMMVTESPSGVNARGSWQGKRILLADDSAENRVLVQALLKNMGLVFEAVSNGQQALEAYKREPADLVLMDMQMPVLDGYSAVRAIRIWENGQDLRRVPIVALTAYALAEEIKKSHEAGCDFHLSKPFSKSQLLDVLQRHMTAE